MDADYETAKGNKPEHFKWGQCPACGAPRHEQAGLGGGGRRCKKCEACWDAALDTREPSNGSERYGQLYWCVETPTATIRLMADELRVEPSGTLVALQKLPDGEPARINMAWAPGQWLHVFAASLMDGSAVAVEHWDVGTQPKSTARSKPRRRPK